MLARWGTSCRSYSTSSSTDLLVSEALVFFEYSLTISDEIRLFWGKKATGAVVLFLANRYLTLAYMAFEIAWTYTEPIVQSGKVRAERASNCHFDLVGADHRGCL